MPVQHGMWKIGETPQALSPVRLEIEVLLEEQVVKDISRVLPAI